LVSVRIVVILRVDSVVAAVAIPGQIIDGLLQAASVYLLQQSPRERRSTSTYRRI
jgi:hypothetical protein